MKMFQNKHLLLIVGLFVAVLGITHACVAGGFNVAILPQEVTGGEGFLMTIEENTVMPAEYRVEFDGAAYAVYRDVDNRPAVFIPVPIEAGGEKELVVTRLLASGRETSKSVTLNVLPRDITTVQISSSGMRTRRQQPAIQEEQEQVLSSIRVRTPDRYWQDDFMLPLQARISAGFALRRQRGDYVTYHRGVDLAAPAGTPIKAINCGRVVLSARGFNIYGNLVVIDHGHGVISCYFHMQDVLVENDVNVSRGDIIGTVGQTGWASGPHLHWGVYLQGVAVDPHWWVSFFSVP